MCVWCVCVWENWFEHFYTAKADTNYYYYGEKSRMRNYFPIDWTQTVILIHSCTVTQWSKHFDISRGSFKIEIFGLISVKMHATTAVNHILLCHIIIIIFNAHATAIEQWFRWCDRHSQREEDIDDDDDDHDDDEKACQTDVNMDCVR